MLCHAVSLVVSSAYIVLVSGVVIGRRNGRTVIVAASTLTTREVRALAVPLLDDQEIALCDAAFGYAAGGEPWLDEPIFVPPLLAHPCSTPINSHGRPLFADKRTPELVGGNG